MFKLVNPVYLYVKKHNISGLKYFGRTIKDPFKYKGSGLYWVRHIEKHGNDVSTLIVGIYEDEKKLHADAYNFSIKNNIIESSEWANLIIETGHSGNENWVPNEDFKQKISENSTKLWANDSHREKMKISQSKSWDKARKENHSAKMKEIWKDPDRIKARKEWLKSRKDITDKLSKSRLGKNDTAETRKKKSIALKRYKKTDLHKKNISLSKAYKSTKVPENCHWIEESKSYFFKDLNIHIKRNTDGHWKRWICIETNQRFKTLQEVRIYNHE